MRIADCGMKGHYASRRLMRSLHFASLASVPNEFGPIHFDSVVAGVSGDVVAGDCLFVWGVGGVPV